MSTITIQDLEKDVLGVLHRVETGESIIVVRGNEVIAEVRPVPGKPFEDRPFGLAAGQFTVPDDFDAPLPDDILREFEV
jgi:antitoxin (DNA-binding transcriptional repressor) of toxin-antitoxin stability system